jgi:integrase
MSVRKREWTTRKGEQKEAWIAAFTDNAGKRHIRTFAQKKAADAYEARVRVDIQAGTHVALDNDLTIAGVAEKWIKTVEVEGKERTTVRQYRQHVEHHIKPRIGAAKLAKLTREHVAHFRDGLLSGVGDQHKALSRQMARKVFVSFKSMLKTVQCSHLADNITVKACRGLPLAHVPRVRSIPTPVEVKRLIEAAADNLKMYTFLKVAALTGLRSSELLGLRWSDVEPFGAAELRVRQRADRYSNIGALKSKKSRRSIPHGPDLVLALKEWKLACPKGDAGLVFPTSKGSVENYNNVLRALEPIMKAAGVVNKKGEPKYALHAFRHFFASWCINPKDRGGRELSPKVVQTLLGHSSIQMTMDVYGTLFPSGNDRSELAASEKALLG